MEDNKILALGPDGKPCGGWYAVNPSGHLIAAKTIPMRKIVDGNVARYVPKDGWRWASAEDVGAARDHASKLDKADPPKAKVGGPLKKGG